MKNDDEVFGELQYDSIWQKDEKMFFLSKEYNIKLFIEGDEKGDFSDAQKCAYQELKNKYDDIMNKIKIEIFCYYQSVYEEYREMYEEDADKYAPCVSCFEELKGYIRPQSIIISNSSKERIISFLFKTKWDLEYGIGIKMVDGKVKIVGIQNDVL